VAGAVKTHPRVYREIPGFDPPGSSRPSANVEPPFSDEEREAAGLPPIDSAKLQRQNDARFETAGARNQRLRAAQREQEAETRRTLGAPSPGTSSPASPPSQAAPASSSSSSSGPGVLASAATGAQAAVTGNWRGVSPAGLALGFFTWAIVLQLIRYGSKGPGDWVKAKFINKTTATPTTTTSAATGPPGSVLT